MPSLTRRVFLKASGALAVSFGLSPVSAFADDGAALPLVREGKTLVLVFLRGGADGLNLVVPHGDPDYYRLRRELAIPATGDGGVVDLDGFFGLHPRLAPLAGLFRSGAAIAAHAVGHDRNTRSHFEEQDVWETGIVGNTLRSEGWVNRHLASSTGRGPIRAVAIGETLPRVLRGPVPAHAIHALEDLALPETCAGCDALGAALARAYDGAAAPAGEAREHLARTGRTTLAGVDRLMDLVGRPYEPAAPYPETELARKLREAARLVKARLGIEVIEVELGGWDTHQYQGGSDGALADLAGELGGALAAFAADLGDRLEDVLVLTLSDFGRTAAQNGTQGTDHGWASCLLALGGPVRRGASGRPVHADWPGLAPQALHEGRDLAHTIDFRDVMAEGVRVHLGNDAIDRVIPGREFRPPGLFS